MSRCMADALAWRYRLNSHGGMEGCWNFAGAVAQSMELGAVRPKIKNLLGCQAAGVLQRTVFSSGQVC